MTADRAMVTGRTASDVAIVIPCFRHGNFLSGAIESAIGQSHPPGEIIVVDDGSDVARSYPEVTLLRQDNAGLAAARNAGLRAATSSKIVFLDADDLLLPAALELGLQCFARQADAAFVYGAFIERRLGHDWPRFEPASHHHDLVRCNWIACVNAVMFDRAKLAGIGGFDETLGMCEDWDAYLRLSRLHVFAHHRSAVAVYLRHDTNMSNDETELLRWIDAVRRKELARGLDPAGLAAWQEGEGIWRSFYDRKPVPLVKRAWRKARRAGAGAWTVVKRPLSR